MSDSEYSETLDVNGQDENEGNSDIHLQLLRQQQQYLVQQQQQQMHQQLQQQQQQQMQQQLKQQQQNVSYMTYAGSTSSSGDSSISTTSSEESDEEETEDTLELAKITNEVLSLPRGLCENAAIFREFFSLDTWRELPVQVQNHLQQFLPRFNQILPPQIAAVEQTRTISMLFNNELSRFGQAPLKNLQQQLEVGNCRPDIKKLRQNIVKSQRREQRFQHCERLSQMAKQLFLSRQRLLDSAYKSSPDTITKTPKTYKLPNPKPTKLFADNKLSAMRARKRFYSEINQISEQLGLEDNVDLSADEEDDDHRLVAEEIKKDQELQQRCLEDISELKASTSVADRCVYSTVFKKRQDVDDEEAMRVLQEAKQTKLTNRTYKEYLREHKRRKVTEPTLPEFETSDIRLRDICARAQMGGHFRRNFSFGKTPGRKPKITPTTLTTSTSTTTPAMTTTTTSSTTLTATSTVNSNISTITTATTTNTQPIKLTSLPPPQLPPPKLSEPPALVPIQQPTHKKPEAYQIITTAAKSPQKEYHPAPQQLHHHQHSLISSTALGIAHKLNSSNSSNDTLNISQLMSVANHPDNLNLCMDDSSLLAGDHDAFNMLDNEVELQQEEVETFGNTCEETIPAFIIGNDVVMPSSESIHENKQTRNSQHHQTLENIVVSQPLPKLEPISRTPLATNKTASSTTSVSLSTTNTSSTVSELIQETHASYFSLIRDFFCSTPNHRMRYDDLRLKIDVWLRNPITALNEWYSLSENWSSLLKSAINFLVGEFPDLPDEYVPYIEHKIQLNIYQWIGAGRDSDNRLSELCTLWMEKRKQPSDKFASGLTQTELKLEIGPRSSLENEDSREDGVDNGGVMTPPPPLPRYPTNWVVRAATLEEISEFQRQERARFDQPHKAYTYRMYGYESVVGPVKGIYSPLLALSKARGHSMMVGDRPNFVTILTLVRDAMARLPNGEGTRSEISELLKCSQYINRDASENVLQTIVSGALDRMHTEHDPCVRYDPKRKIWIYLHRNRSEEEFERIHQENQTISKTKKPSQRKPKPAVTGKASTTQDLDNVKIMVNTENSNGGGVGSSVTGTLLTMPALVPSNPIIVSNSTLVQRQQQVLQQHQQQQQLINTNKCPPVPPLKYNIPPTQSNSGQQQQQQKSLLKTTIRQDKTISNAANTANIIKQQPPSFQVPQNKNSNNPNTTPIIVATPQGLQTVHVSNATSVMPAQTNNQIQQQHLTQTSTAQQHTNITANLAGKRVTLNKPIIINQVTNSTLTSSPSSNANSNLTVVSNPALVNQKLKSPQQQIGQKTQLIQNRMTLQTNQHQLITQQQQQQSNLIIPISMANNMALNVQSTSNVTEQQSGGHNIPSSPATKSNISQSPAPLTNKQNIIRLVPASNVKTMINTSSPGGTQIVNRQRIITASSAAERPGTPQQQKIQTTGIQLLSNSGNIMAVSGTAANPAGSIVKMSAQQFASLQQKQGQQQQHIVVKQAGVQKTQTFVQAANKPQRLILGNTSIVGQSGQTKNIVLHQSPVASSSVVVTPSQVTTSSTATTTISGNKIQTINARNLTPQQQRILIQNLKQQQQQQQQQTINQNQIQFKTIQVVGGANTSGTQTNLTSARAQTVTMSSATSSAQQNQNKTAMVIVSQDNGGTTQQNVTRILKTTSPQLKTDITNTSGATRIITSSTGQIISLDGLIQKQQGGTIRIASSAGNSNQIKSNQQSIIANVVQKPQQQQQQQMKTKQQQPQYAIVSVPNSIISLGSNSNFTVGQRIITTIAGSSNTTSLVNLNTTKVTPSVVSTSTGRVITATAAGTKIITKQTPIANSPGNIRVINTVNQTGNLNLTTLQGKQVVLAGGKTLNAISKAQIQTQQQQQNVVQTPQGSIVIGGQTVKLQQGNTNIQHLLQKGGNIITSQNATSSTNLTTSASPQQLQTVIMGNQILRVQQMPQIVSTANRINVTSNTKTISNAGNSNLVTTNSNAPKTIFVGSKGQTLRLQPAAGQTQTVTNKNIIFQAQQQNPNSTIKTATSSTTTIPPNRVVLAVQGGGQIFLSPNFQGGNINLKSLQNMKVVSLAQQPSAKMKDNSINNSSSASSTSSTTSSLKAQQTILKTTSITPSPGDTNV